MRCVIALVLPVPAPARMHTGPAAARTAAPCSWSSPLSTEPPVTTGIIPRPTDVVRLVSVLTMYSTSWCGYCHRPAGQLDREGIPYTVVDIEQDLAAAEYVMSVNGGNQTVPTVRFPDGSALTNPSI